MTQRLRNKYSVWFDLTVGPLEGGRVIRYYVITCHDCGRQNSYHANNMSDEALRKLYVRRGWEVGKSRTTHRCDECKHKRPRPVVAEPQSNVVPMVISDIERLWHAWHRCNDDQRLEFFLKIQEQLAPPAAVEMAPVADPIIEDDDEEPADWWTELEKEKA